MRRITRERGGHLRVDEARRHSPRALEDHLEILPSAVQHPCEARVEQPRVERLEVELGEAVDAGYLLAGADLDEAQLRVVGLLAHELGIDGGDRRRGEHGDESLESGVVVDPTDFLRCRHRRSSLLGRIRYHRTS